MLTMTVHFPAGYQVLGNGLVTGLSSGPSGTIFEWSETYPIATYLISIAAAPYRVIEKTYQDTEGTILLQYYVYDKDQTRAENALNVTAEMMQFFGQLYCTLSVQKRKICHGCGSVSRSVSHGKSNGYDHA